jgi:signal peptidase I
MTAQRARPSIRIAKLLMSALALLALWLMWPTTLGGDVAYIQVNGHSMDGTYRSGDLVVVRAQSHYAVGDIIAYRIPKGDFAAGAKVIHRIIGGNGIKGFITQGDNKPSPDDWHPKNADVVGHAWLHVAGVGTWFSRLAAPLPLGALCAGLTMVTMLFPRRDPKHIPRRATPLRLQTTPLTAAQNPSVPSPRNSPGQPTREPAKR